MKRSLYFWVLLPLVYAIVAIVLDALLFSQWTVGTTLLQILNTNVMSYVDVFQCIVVLVAIGVAYLLAGSSAIQKWKRSHRSL